MKTRLILTILNICLAIPIVSYLIHSPEMEVVSAAGPAPVVIVEKPSLDIQATSLTEVEDREIKPLNQPFYVYENLLFAYQISYPFHWQIVETAPNVVTFEADDKTAQVSVTSVGPLGDGLELFVLRSLEDDVVIARQSLVINNFPAERVITYSNETGDQQIRFFINTGKSAYIIAGTGNRMTIEMMAQSLNNL